MHGRIPDFRTSTPLT